MRDGRRSHSPAVVRNVNISCATLIESYCKSCGLLIAASPHRRIIQIMERIHECPVYCCYARPAQSTCRPKLKAFSVGASS